ncbi:ser/Thr protein phosphatase superfamily [Verticillium alfalfae VaMs.102]|uniref:Ser/Thr protein phosphatase superfamily n=1 Tax=Verticillium alfalfae (strain VaMs.102 / ATCC MYA-4576 / FGSC 10136) TaxID=526221 RepID=C9SKA7_VERA1|nr:ser/Thr protein phosphatase superfamily [Verticillium alfalfae VaMs.102]EEY19125.1 ser/Thr protein phosphatase superfamily [Verticillium alfalfae VaMs.102]
MNIVRAIQAQLRPASGPRVQILSDLHLEVCQQYASYRFQPSAPLLLLGGDIGRLIDYEGYLHFLEAQVARYQKVFLVLGNHEFFGLGYDAGLAQARRLAAEPSLAAGLVLLHKTRWDDPESGLTILGCTLWSALPEDSYDLARARVSDYAQIHGWTPARHNEVHADEVAWLREQVAQVTSGGRQEGRARQLLVATHHAPCVKGTSRPEHAASPLSSAFATDLVHEKAWAGIKVWVFGHTHFSTSFTQNGIRLVANQRGYVLPNGKTLENESKAKGRQAFDAAKFVTL